jgi:DNA repair protein RecN (Recombination protein N)
MLYSISIRNVVLIEKLDLDVNQGLTVLTGETGAGKSILLDSLGLCMGNRADTSLIRQGTDKLSVTANFIINDKNNPIWNILENYDIENDNNNEIIVKRTLNTDGRGKAFINDQSVGIKLLKEVSKYLIEIHGQFDTHGLLNPATHIDVLDSYAGNFLLLEETAKTYANWKNSEKERIKAENDLYNSKEEEDYLTHCVNELEKSNPKSGEEEELSQKRSIMMNSEKIIEALNHAYSSLSHQSNIEENLRSAMRAIDNANNFTENRFIEIYNSLDGALIEISEATNNIELNVRNIELDPNELERIDNRLFSLKSLARKHQCNIDDLEEKLSELKEKLNNITFGEDKINSLREIEEKNKLEYIHKANCLSQTRKKQAEILDKLVMVELKPLKMEKAKFVTSIEKTNENTWSKKGFDEVMFTVATNPNSPQGAINKIASGGELARFMLALKVNLAKTSTTHTLIFDEVDTGVGGATAEAIGDRLAKLAKDLQVMVVTHSPQVASKANNHLYISKRTVNDITTTNVKELSNKEKIEEVARMLAGETITNEARAAANILIGA